MVDVKYFNCKVGIKKFCYLTTESKTFFIANKVFNIDHPFLDVKIRLRIKKIIPNKDLKVTIKKLISKVKKN